MRIVKSQTIRTLDSGYENMKVFSRSPSHEDKKHMKAILSTKLRTIYLCCNKSIIHASSKNDVK